MGRPYRRVLSLGFLVVLLAGCVSVGEEFRTPTAEMIKNGVTTRAELLQLFGSPTQVGIEDGNQTWTWVYVRAGGIGRPLSKELHVTFNDRGIVKSYSYTSGLPEEVQRQVR
ncbi:MAG: outer membrane protein assembly factor BamE [Candidatus Methylomirabilis sp.]|nr:outer membrane protein assembly factor BamE [Candidatus Methylomirabilis sp.]